MDSRRVRAPRAAQRHQAPTVGLVVEGQTEFIAFPKLHRLNLVPGCPPLKPSNLNGVGEDLSAIGLAKRVLPKVVAHQVAGRSRVIVCFDRERRLQAAIDLQSTVAAELARLLTLKGRSAGGVFVVVADRAFEAWLLAGAGGLAARRLFRRLPPFMCFEGELGAREHLGVEELTALLGRAYKKTRDGPDLFEAIDFVEARRHGSGRRGSASLDAFLRAVGV